MTDDLASPAQPDADLVAGIAAMMKSLDEPVATDSQQRRFRVVVATDWSSASVPFAVLRGYSQIIPADAPVDLVFAVPHEVTQADLAAVTTLCEELGEDAQIAGLGLEHFPGAAGHHAYAAVIPNGDPGAVVMELAAFFSRLHELALLVSDPGRLAAQPVPEDGYNAGLDRRLTAYRELSAAGA